MENEHECTPVASVTGLYRATLCGLELLTEDTPLTPGEVRENPVIFELVLYPASVNDSIIIDLIYDNLEPIPLPDLVRGVDIPRGIPFWLDWFEIPPFREMCDMTGRRVYPRAAGIHTVRFRIAKKLSVRQGRIRNFSPANGGWMSPAFTFAIATGM